MACSGQGLHVRMLVLLVSLDQVPGPHGMRRPAEHHEPGGHGLH